MEVGNGILHSVERFPSIRENFSRLLTESTIADILRSDPRLTELLDTNEILKRVAKYWFKPSNQQEDDEVSYFQIFTNSINSLANQDTKSAKICLLLKYHAGGCIVVKINQKLGPYFFIRLKSIWVL